MIPAHNVGRSGFEGILERPGVKRIRIQFIEMAPCESRSLPHVELMHSFVINVR